MSAEGNVRELSRTFEDVWGRLWAEFSLREGFWLGVLFGAQPYEVAELVERSGLLLRRGARIARRLNLDSGTVAAVLAEMARPMPPSVGASWIADEQHRPPGERLEMWRRFLRRLNERRDAVREQHPAGLLLLCPSDAVPVIREEAPDLWSFRSLAASLEPEGGVAAGLGVPASPTWGTGAASRSEPEVPTPIVGEPIQPSSAVRTLLRHLSRALTSGDIESALRIGVDADRQATTPIDRTLVWAWLAQARHEHGDSDEAERLALAALFARLPLEVATTVRLLEILARSDRLVMAADAARLLVDVRRDLLDRSPDSSETLRDLSVSLNEVGDAALRRGDLAAAADAYTESLTVARRLLDTYGERPDTLRDLSVYLTNVGRVAEQQDDLAAAADAYTESLTVARRLLDTYGERPDTLRDLSVSLNDVGDVALRRGDLAAAADAYTESLTVARRLLDTYGERPDTLGDLSIYLNNVGDVALQRGDLAAAADAYTESLTVARRLLDTYGERPDTLRDLSIYLNDVGRVALGRGDLAAAADAYTESLTVARRLLDTYGERPDTLRDLSIYLTNVGRVALGRGDLAAAADAYTESLTVARRLLDTYGERPDTLRDLSLSLNHVGRVAEQQGDLPAAADAYAEEIEMLRVLARYGTDWAESERLGLAQTALARVMREGDLTVS